MPEKTTFERAAVIGSGVMGAQIAAHLANAGIPTLLLDMAQGAPDDEEKARGLDASDPRVANRIVAAGLERARRAKPAAFFTPRDAALVSIGNLDHDLERLRDADWIVEAIVENLEIKRALFQKIAPYVSDHAVVSTNTSGISVTALAEALPLAQRPRFLATHFFNPPRYLHLLEVVPGPETDTDVVADVTRFAEERLGKGVVIAKDTPNFIANRIGVHTMINAVHLMLEEKLSIAQVDALTGLLIGRPKSATFRTADVVGLDTLVFVADNLAERLPRDPERARYVPPDFVRKMVDRKYLGEKTGQGFYRREGHGSTKRILMLDPETLDYVEQPEVAYPSVAEAKKAPSLAERVRLLTGADDAAGRYLRRYLTDTARYAAICAKEIADDIPRIDNAMRWGFGWEMGPFELWDALGVEATVKRLEREEVEVPELVGELRGSGRAAFYEGDAASRTVFDFDTRASVGVPDHPRHLSLARVAGSGGVVEDTESATILDIGKEVLCIAFKGRMNPIGPETIDVMHRAMDRAEESARGIVIGNDAEHFSAGANLKLMIDAIDKGELERIERIVKALQDVNQRLRFCDRPVVVACHGYTLGGACEVLLGADRVCAAAESYIGLPELGAGVIPAGAGTKELIKRLDESVPRDAELNLFPLLRRLFEIVGTARVATSAREAMELGFLRATDRIVMNRRFLLDDARRMVVALDTEGYAPPRPRTDIRVLGEPALATFRAAMHNLRDARRITEYDQVVGEELAWVLVGGDLTGPARVSEQYLLDLEREAFMRRVRDPRTRARMEHLMSTGKPLRN